MARSNYALISALYSDKSRGLYSDIYFPIIKYAIVKIYGSKKEGEHYATSDNVQQKIAELFGIKIPHAVIAKTILKLSHLVNGSIGLNVFEDGNTFQIISARFDDNDDSYEELETAFNRHLTEIESEYKGFIEREGAFDDKVTFTEFISKNTDNILGYFENDSESQVEEQYTSMVFFLAYLHTDNPELYKVANQLFWGSVIAAFLQSDRPKVHDEERGCEAEYYLDTPIAMALLDLSTPENELSASDVCDIIKSSGGILKIHPVTIEEMKTILGSVAQNGPYPGTGIANACTRRKLYAPEITKLLLNLQKELESKGVMVFPASMPDCRRQVMSKYKGKPVLRDLAAIRNDNAGVEAQNMYFSDQFREAHDIFMDDYIKEQRKAKNDRNNIFFLTTNADLITFCKNRHTDANYMLSTSKVILELWMHNAQPSKVSASALTEAMARCLDLHRSKVRTKLHEVAKFFNRNKDDIAPEVYNEFLRLLYRRARNVVAAVEQAPEGDSKAYLQNLQVAIKEDQAHFDAINSEVNSKKESLEQKVAQQEIEISGLSGESGLKSQRIKGLTEQTEKLEHQNNKLKSDIGEMSKELGSIQEEIAKLREEKKESDKLNALYAKRDSLEEKLVQLKSVIDPLETKRCSSFSYRCPMILRIIGISLIVVVVLLLIIDKVVNLFTFITWGAAGVIVAVGGIITTYAFNIGSEEKVNKRREQAFAIWDKEHSNYSQLKVQIEETEKELNRTKLAIRDSSTQKE